MPDTTMPTPLNAASLLHSADLRATSGRIALLELLAKEKKPLSVTQITTRLKGALNPVTLYRALEALQKAGIIARVNLEHDHAHFEFVFGRPHHHHAVCERCGRVEDIEIPCPKNLKQDAAKRSGTFTSFSHYSLDFFGTCRPCSLSTPKEKV